jgi:hypothetical protein
MPPVNVPITKVWPSGITNTGGVEWISADSPGVDDPQPINSTIGIKFNSGAQINRNNITLYLRGNENVPVTEATLNNQLVGTLDGYALASNDTLPPSLQGTPAPNAFNIQVNLQWGDFDGIIGYQISLSNSTSPIVYQYNTLVSGDILHTSELNPNTNYLLYAILDDETIEVSIYPFNNQGYLDAPVFTSAPIKDTSVFCRIPGHVGINVNTLDTGAAVYSLRPYHTMFAEFESNTFNSHTPVIGAQLYAQNTPPTQLFYPPFMTVTSSDGITPTVTLDSGRTTTGQSSRIVFGQSAATETFQGLTTQPLTPIGDDISGITDYNAISASFDIWIESSAIANTLNPFIGLLINEQGYGIPLQLPSIVPNKWNHGVISVLVNPNVTPFVLTENINTILSTPVPINRLIPSGLYKFAVLYVGGGATTAWIDNLQITSEAVSWSGRVTDNNPYIKDLAPWVPFSSTVNANNSGIRFDQPGYALQVRAQALQQDAEIYNGYTVVPNYAQLGRIVADTTDPIVIPSSDITVTATSLGGDTFMFTADITSDTGTIYNIEWSFGDGGYAFDQWIQGEPNTTRIYTYTQGATDIGQYYATAAVVDNFNNRGYGTTLLSL